MKKTVYRDRSTTLHNHFIGSLIFHLIGLTLLVSVPLHTGGAGADSAIHVVLFDSRGTVISADESQKRGPAKKNITARQSVTARKEQEIPVLDKGSSNPAEGEEKVASEITGKPETQDSSPEISAAEPDTASDTGQIEAPASTDEATAGVSPDEPFLDPGQEFEDTIQPVKEDMVSTEGSDPAAISGIAVEQMLPEIQNHPVQDAALPVNAEEPDQSQKAATADKPAEPAADQAVIQSSDNPLESVFPLLHELPGAADIRPEPALTIDEMAAEATVQTVAAAGTSMPSVANRDIQHQNSDAADEIIKKNPELEKGPKKAEIKKIAVSINPARPSGNNVLKKTGDNATEQGINSSWPDLLAGRFQAEGEDQKKQSETKTVASGTSEASPEEPEKAVAIEDNGPEIGDERISADNLSNIGDYRKSFHTDNGGERPAEAEPAKPEKSILLPLISQDFQSTKKSSTGIRISEALIKKDIKISVITTDTDNSVIMGLFRRSAAERQRRAASFREEPVSALLERKKADIQENSGLKHLISVLNADDGIYTFVLKNKGEKPCAVQVAFYLFEGKAAERVKEYREIELSPGDRTEFRFILPNAFFWDDEDRFSGSIEDSSATTKFHYESGLVWKEKKEQNTPGLAEMFEEESFMTSEIQSFEK